MGENLSVTHLKISARLVRHQEPKSSQRPLCQVCYEPKHGAPPRTDVPEPLCVRWVCSLPAAVGPGGRPGASPGATRGLTAREVTPSLAKARAPLQRHSNVFATHLTADGFHSCGGFPHPAPHLRRCSPESWSPDGALQKTSALC